MLEKWSIPFQINRLKNWEYYIASEFVRRTQEAHVEETEHLFKAKVQNYKIFASQTKREKFKKVTKLCICIQKVNWQQP